MMRLLPPSHFFSWAPGERGLFYRTRSFFGLRRSGCFARLKPGKTWLRTLFCALLCSVWFSLTLEGAERRRIDQLGVIVNDKAVTLQELANTQRLQEQELRRQFKGKELAEKLKGLRARIIEDIIQSLLLESRAEQLGIEVSEAEMESRINLIVKRDANISNVYTDTQIREFVLRDILRKRVMQQEVNAKVVVQTKDVRAACQVRSGEKREVDAAHILVRGHGKESLARIRALRKKLVEGQEFSRLAVSASADPQARDNQGRIGYISRGQFVRAFEDAAFALKVGQLSDPVKTRFGYHLIKIYGQRTSAGIDCNAIPPAQARLLRDELWNTRRLARLKTYLADLRGKADIVIAADHAFSN